MQLTIESNQEMKKEIITAISGVLMITAVFIFQPDIIRHSSPLALFVITIVGLIFLFLKFKLPGSIFLLFGGLALVVHPLMFSLTFWVLPGGVVTGFAGAETLIKWWRQDND